MLRPQPGVMAEGRIQWVRPHTPDTVWRPETITTENGAEGLTDICSCVDDPAAVAARYGRYVGRAPIMRGGTHVVPLERGGLVFADAPRGREDPAGLSARRRCRSWPGRRCAPIWR